MSTTEYVAVVLLVSLVLAVGGAQIAGVDVAEAVGRKIKVALCVVAGDDCDENGEARVCVAAADGAGASSELGLVVAKLDDGRYLVTERLTNGRIRYSVLEQSGAAASIDVGAKAFADGVDVSVGGELGGEVRVRRVYEPADAAEAARMRSQIESEGWRKAGALGGAIAMMKGNGEGSTEQEVEFTARGQATAALSALGLDAGMASLSGGPGGGLRRNHRTGETAVLLSRKLEVSGELDATYWSLGGKAGGEVRTEVVFDRAGRPTKLRLLGEADVKGQARVIGAKAEGAKHAELEAEVDLTDPDLAAEAARLAKGDVTAFPGVLRRAVSDARLTTRFYDVSQEEERDGIMFLGLGYENRTYTDSRRLTSAYVRKPGHAITDWDPTCEITA